MKYAQTLWKLVDFVRLRVGVFILYSRFELFFTLFYSGFIFSLSTIRYNFHAISFFMLATLFCFLDASDRIIRSTMIQKFMIEAYGKSLLGTRIILEEKF